MKNASNQEWTLPAFLLSNVQNLDRMKNGWVDGRMGVLEGDNKTNLVLEYFL
jgi:hypothetical protein